jgi:hypothetical protein
MLKNFNIFLLKNFVGVIKKEEIGGSCSTITGEQSCGACFMGNLEGKKPLGRF